MRTRHHQTQLRDAAEEWGEDERAHGRRRRVRDARDEEGESPRLAVKSTKRPHGEVGSQDEAAGVVPHAHDVGEVGA